ncbi:hypothetical protein ACP70R_021490 [Stipagrostis hirtigluma subsp. patula]
MAAASSTTIGAGTWSPTSSPAKESDAEKLRFMEDMTADVDAVQERVLAEILRRNAGSEHLVKCGLAGATDRATFRAKVPIVAYEDLQPYIQRIADGDRSPVLTGPGHTVSEFFTSSGTSSGGERKLIPVVEDEFGRLQQMSVVRTAVMSQHVPGHDKGKGLYFLFVKPGTTTPGGLPARTAQTSIFKSHGFASTTRHSYTSPMAAILCENASQSMYAHMVCGLCQRHDVLRVGAAFASGLLRAIRFLQQHWEQVAADVEAGALDGRVTDQAVREAVAGILRPDPELARFIRAECSKGVWAGIIRRMWPNAKYLETIVTGSMAQYVPNLAYYGSGLPMASTAYVSSECFFGLNLRPMCDPSEVSYTIMPNMAYFEFLPVEAADATMTTTSRQQQQLVNLAGVEVGREYEVVVTTYAGLSRYRVGDVLRVTGFHNAAPQFRFVRRGGVVLSVDVDKTDEAELQRAVERASSALLRRHGAAVLDYTARTCTESVPGHYVVYWELTTTTTTLANGEAAAVEEETLDRCCLEMENALSTVYRQCRVADGSIGPLEVRVVRPGTFEELMDHAVSRGASAGQYKVPRCVTDHPAIVELLDSHVVSSHLSPALPHWAPAR